MICGDLIPILIGSHGLVDLISSMDLVFTEHVAWKRRIMCQEVELIWQQFTIRGPTLSMSMAVICLILYHLVRVLG